MFDDAVESEGITDGRPEYRSDFMLEANQEEDVSGAGIFDNVTNLHQGDGIFQDHWALPGYLARETGNGPSEVVDNQTGTPINSFASGMWRSQQYLPSSEPRWPYPPLQEYTPDWRKIVASEDGQRVIADRFTDMPGMAMAHAPYPAPPGQVPETPIGPPAGDAVRVVDWQPPTMLRTNAKPVHGLGMLGDMMDDISTADPIYVVVGGIVAGALLKLGYDYAKKEGWF